VIARTIATQPNALLPRDVRFLRRHLELTQAELSRRLCVDSQTVARWEKGQTEMPGSSEILLRLLVLSRDAEAAPVQVGNDLSSLIDQLSRRSVHQRSALVFSRGESGWALQSV
jgi:transcriptional regulator with XRE-family HTH domain